MANAILLVTFVERSRVERREPWEAAIEGAGSAGELRAAGVELEVVLSADVSGVTTMPSSNCSAKATPRH